jgi:hypothetical protein
VRNRLTSRGSSSGVVVVFRKEAGGYRHRVAGLDVDVPAEQVLVPARNAG